MNDLLKHVLPLAELTIIKRDFDILKKIAFQMKPELQLQLIPYTALFCYGAIEYLNNNGYEISIEQTSKYSIKEIRQKAKFFDLRLNKLLQSVNNVDQLQNEYFINLLKQPEYGIANIHQNIGIWYDSDKNIVGNTHYAYYVFQDEKMISKPSITLQNLEIENKEIYAFAYDMGRIIGGICPGLSRVNDFVKSDFSLKDIDIFSRDLNTNNCISKDNEFYKVIRLFLLHVLSSIGFILFILKKSIIRDTGMQLRLDYITYHYAFERLKKLQLYCRINRNDIKDKNLLDALSSINFSSQDTLKNPEFRNCMMHFQLRTKDGLSLIKESCIDLSIPFCGLVESQFKNMTYSSYKMKIENELIGASEILRQYLDFEL